MKKMCVFLLALVFMFSFVAASIVSAEPDKDMNGAAKYLKDKFGFADVSKEFDQKTVKSDELGYKHVKLQQTVNSIPVFGNEYIVHFDAQGKVYAANGGYDSKAKDYKAGKLMKPEEAIAIAKAEVEYTAEVNTEMPDIFSSELYLYNINDQYIPVYLAKLNWVHSDSFANWVVFVNAENGDIVNKYNDIRTTSVTGTGVGVLGDTKSIYLDYSGGYYYLKDLTKGAVISVYDAGTRTKLPGTLMKDTDTTWNAATQKAGVDAEVYVGMTYNYYYNTFGRNSIDGRGMEIKATVHYSRNYVNAFWNGRQMVFGDGDGVNSLALSGSLDVIAHELTHGVDSYEANLTYQYQSGAVSESISDIMGTAVEFYGQPTKADWLIGEDVWTPKIANDALRSMADPTKYGDPAHMNNYVNTTSDYGGVHTNSGIPNKAAYLIGSNIGADKMGRIYYRALSTYWTSSTNFSQARAGVLQAAADLYGANGTEYSTAVSAFNTVGIY